MLEAIERRRALDHHRGLHLLGRRDRPRSSREALAANARARRHGQDPARRGRLVEHRRRHPRDRSRGGGCQLAWYNPIRWYTLGALQPPHPPQVADHRRPRRVHRRRRHRRPLAGRRAGSRHWRDMQIRIEGPAVTPLQTGFAQNWLQTTGELISGPLYYPPLEPAGPLAAADDHELAGDRRVDGAHHVLPVDRLRAASRSTSPIPYFVPDAAALDALVEAKQRGVDVRVMVVGHPQRQLAGAPQQRPAVYGRLLEAGVEILEYNRTMLHHKTMVVDGAVGRRSARPTSTTGRSRTTKRTTSACYDPALCRTARTRCSRPIGGCDRVHLAAWRRRGVHPAIQRAAGGLPRRTARRRRADLSSALVAAFHTFSYLRSSSPTLSCLSRLAFAAFSTTHPQPQLITITAVT